MHASISATTYHEPMCSQACIAELSYHVFAFTLVVAHSPTDAASDTNDQVAAKCADLHKNIVP